MAAAATLHAATLTVATLEPKVLEDNLRSAPRDNLARQSQIAQLFTHAGCSGANLEERPLKHSRFANVACTLTGKEGSGIIVVGAHFDHVTEGDGIVDNWSGAALLPALYASLSAQPRTHTLVFAAFAREEEGLLGSHEFVTKLSKEYRTQIQAMVNIDSIGMAEPAIWLHHSDKPLAAAAFLISQTVAVPLETINVEQVGDSDASSFIAAINLAAYADTWRFIANYLAFLDQR